MCKPLIALNKTRLDFAGKHQKEIALFWKTFFCQMITDELITLELQRRRETAHELKHTTLSVIQGGSNVIE